MNVEAVAAPSWGIDSGTFLWAYAVLAVVVLLLGYRIRRRLAEGPDKIIEPDLHRHPHDLAYLTGRGQLAVYSALSAMHLRGTIVSEGGSVQAVGRLDDNPDALEHAVHQSARNPVRVQRLAAQHRVGTALTATCDRLVTSGLLLSGGQRTRIKRVGWWLVLVALFGLYRLLTEVADGRGGVLLAVEVLVVGALAVLQSLTAPRMTRAANRMVARLRTEQHEMAPSMKPDWTVYGPEGAALGIGLWGTSALWASDPAFADELALQRAAAGSSDGGVGVIDTSGGGGDSGGGSSCGGGGGGGGGCGGGG
jgi:uncharacterized protein (TIGR04222 family)